MNHEMRCFCELVAFSCIFAASGSDFPEGFPIDGCQKPNEKNQYSILDRAILMRDGFLEIDMVFSGLSVVSHVGFKQKNLEVQK